MKKSTLRELFVIIGILCAGSGCFIIGMYTEPFWGMLAFLNVLTLIVLIPIYYETKI